MLNLKQLINFKEKNVPEEYNMLGIKKSFPLTNGTSGETDYEISGLMPVKIYLIENMTEKGIKFNLKDLLREYAEQNHGSRHIVINKLEIPENSHIKNYKFHKWSLDENYYEDYISFNVFYSYHRHTEKYSDERFDKEHKKMMEDIRNAPGYQV